MLPEKIKISEIYKNGSGPLVRLWPQRQNMAASSNLVWPQRQNMAASSNLFAIPSRLHTSSSPFICNILILNIVSLFDIILSLFWHPCFIFSRTKPESSSYPRQIMPGQSELRIQRFGFFIGDHQRSPGAKSESFLYLLILNSLFCESQYPFLGFHWC